MKKIFLLLFLTLPLKISGQNWQWAKQAGSTSMDYVQDMCTDPNGDVYIIGEFSIPGLLT